MKEQILADLRLITHWDEEKANYWYYTPNPNFGGATPDRLVKAGRGHKVLLFIEGCHKDMERVVQTVREIAATSVVGEEK